MPCLSACTRPKIYFWSPFTQGPWQTINWHILLLIQVIGISETIPHKQNGLANYVCITTAELVLCNKQLQKCQWPTSNAEFLLCFRLWVKFSSLSLIFHSGAQSEGAVVTWTRYSFGKGQKYKGVGRNFPGLLKPFLRNGRLSLPPPFYWSKCATWPSPKSVSQGCIFQLKWKGEEWLVDEQ